MKRLTKCDYIKKFKLIHGNSYDYSKFEYIDRSKKSIIICPIHGEFLQYAGHHIRGCGCQNCAKKKTNDIQRIKVKLPLSEFILRANKLHNEKYDYSLIKSYNNIREKLKIICPIHGPFEQCGHNHLGGRGCKQCGQHKTRNSERSQYEVELFNELVLLNKDIMHNDRTVLEGYELDMVNHFTQKAIEFNGDYWHCNPNKYSEDFEIKQLGMKAKDIWAHDRMKISFAARKGYDVLIIWESDYLKDKLSIIDKCDRFLKGF